MGRPARTPWQAWLLATAAALGAALHPAGGSTAQTPSGPALYADDPNHLWNRVHRDLFVRVDGGEQYGLDEVDPLLWRQTRHLLAGRSHTRAIRSLDEFLSGSGEKLVSGPLERAAFQHDLWAVFDWLAGGVDGHEEARKALMPRLARVIRRVALGRDQVEGLPDSYAAAVASRAFPATLDPGQPDRAFLPSDLLAPDGSWTVISGTQPVAPQHAGELGRSAFSIFWRVPGGSAPTLAYLKSLWDFPEPHVVDPGASFDGERRVMLNPALPSVPAGTHLALVRTMLLIDREGAIVPTPLVERVQLRVLGDGGNRFFEFRMRRARLFAREAGGLEAVRPADLGFLTFSSHGIDPFESATASGRRKGSAILAGCVMCHQRERPLLETVLSVRQLLKPQAMLDSRHPRWARWFTQGAAAAGHKSRRADWGLLQGLWQSHPW